MGIRWEDYKNRRSLSLPGWAGYYGIRTYEDMRSHLLRAGVIPPDEGHKDVLLALGLHEPVSVKDSESLIPEQPAKQKKSVDTLREKPAVKRKSRAKRTTRKKSPAKSSKK